MNITNHGNHQSDIEISVSGEKIEWVDLSRNYLLLGMNGTGSILIVVTVPEDQDGSFRFVLNIHSDGVTDEVPFTVEIVPEFPLFTVLLAANVIIVVIVLAIGIALAVRRRSVRDDTDPWED